HGEDLPRVAAGLCALCAAQRLLRVLRNLPEAAVVEVRRHRLHKLVGDRHRLHSPGLGQYTGCLAYAPGRPSTMGRALAYGKSDRVNRQVAEGGDAQGRPCMTGVSFPCVDRSSATLECLGQLVRQEMPPPGRMAAPILGDMPGWGWR